MTEESRPPEPSPTGQNVTAETAAFRILSIYKSFAPCFEDYDRPLNDLCDLRSKALDTHYADVKVELE
ncbi:hypothetical protein EVAR_2235_1 [Eumeta japonica]|uniref:Uncharacterized protein n=1 Tax=Eumeta variegata TaxID=151549 RepID=A0A4C1SIF5_EUMVA|nr:hypothetical protein EVAR_2235_1 [Eumeta japonica]